MASTNKTGILRLNQWVRTDPVLMDDFNADNLKIEQAMASANQAVADVAESVTLASQELSADIAGLRQDLGVSARANRWETLYDGLNAAVKSSLEIQLTSANGILIENYLSLRVYLIDENSRHTGIKLRMNSLSTNKYHRYLGDVTSTFNYVTEKGGFLDIDLCASLVTVRGAQYFWEVPELSPDILTTMNVYPYTNITMPIGSRVILLGVRK